MNCLDCRDYFAAAGERLLPPQIASEFQRHLASCPACREDEAAANALHDRLLARAGAAAGVSLAVPVMRRIRAQSAPAAYAPRLRPLKARWLTALAGVGAAAALLVVALMLAPSDTRAQAIAVMNRGVNATTGLRSIHLQGRMRTAPADNFSFIDVKRDFTAIELWKELDGLKRWRIEKPGRVAVMDGASTQLYLRPTRSVRKVPLAMAAPFDTGWLHSVSDIETTLTKGLAMAQTHAWKMELTRATDAAGVVHQVVAIDVPAPVTTGDYLYNQFLSTAETRRLYRFNDQTGQLEALQIYARAATDYILVFEATQIEYNQTFGSDVFTLDLPQDTIEELPVRNSATAIDPKYTGLTAEQAARMAFEACARQDWNELQVFWPLPINDQVKMTLGGITVVRIGEAFTSAASTAQFVPYEITLSDGTTKQQNLALKKDPQTGVWRIDGGL